MHLQKQKLFQICLNLRRLAIPGNAATAAANHAHAQGLYGPIGGAKPMLARAQPTGWGER